MADVLYEAGGEDPALLIDFATLTGAARVALGPDLPGFFCNDDGPLRVYEEFGFVKRGWMGEFSYDRT